ncbi:alpha-2,8-sialyltransferase 8B-like isoform X2 [Amphiura filiformis]|uniref:alpha-2,8-sialyltransferase 8B-like isoform X2 n=1 Tax=Amphiura filiformis TaxID=82378 RepID=UPI003B220EB4
MKNKMTTPLTKVCVFALLCVGVFELCGILHVTQYILSTATRMRNMNLLRHRQRLWPEFNRTTLRPYIFKLLPLSRTLHAFYKQGEKDNYRGSPKYNDMLLYPDPSSGIRQFNTCAVVGNGGILKNSHCGNEIDGMDFVLRFNMATLKGYTDDVGLKTTIMSMNKEGLGWVIGNLTNGTDLRSKTSVQERLYSLPKNTILWHCKRTKLSQTYLRAMYDILNGTNHQHNELRLAFAASDIVKPVKNVWRDIPQPTSGLIGFTFAAALCNKITVYGFYPFYRDENNNPVSNHYYETTKFNFTSDTNHTYHHEYFLLKHLNRTGAIRLVTSHCSYGEKLQ